MSAQARADEELAKKLPKAVQMQLEKANQLKEEIEKRFNASSPNGSQAVQVEQQSESVLTPQTPVEPVAVKPEDAQKPVPAPEDTKDSRYWEHRFKTFQGISEADKLRMKDKVSNLESKVIELESKLKSQPARPVEASNLEDYLTKDEIDTYGPDVLKAVIKTAQKAADGAADRRLTEELKRLKPLEAKLEEAEAKNLMKREEDFWDGLNKNLPDWANVNENPKFREWLGESDLLSGAVRQNLLDSAQKSLDSHRVVALFKAFLQNSPAPVQSVDTQRRIVPDSVGSGDPTLSPKLDKSVYVTKQEIKDFYKGVSLGRYANRPEARKEMELKIQRASEQDTII